MEIEIAPGAIAMLESQGERAVTIDVTLRFCGGLVTKDAVAFPGEPPGGTGFKHIARDGIDLFWRQRLDVEGADPKVSEQLAPKRLRLNARGSEMLAEAAY